MSCGAKAGFVVASGSLPVHSGPVESCYPYLAFLCYLSISCVAGEFSSFVGVSAQPQVVD